MDTIERRRPKDLGPDDSEEFAAQSSDQTREVYLRTYSGLDSKNQRYTSVAVGLNNIHIPPGYESPVCRVELICATERTYHNGQVAYNIRLEGVKSVKGWEHKMTFGDAVYGDDGIRNLGGGFSYPFFRIPPERLKEGLRPVEDYPERIDTKATFQTLKAQVKARDFKTPQLVLPQS